MNKEEQQAFEECKKAIKKLLLEEKKTKTKLGRMNKKLKYLLEEIKDTTLLYIGTNGCLYQDLLREELNLLLSYIDKLQQENKKQKEVINKLRNKIKLVKEYGFDKVGRYELLDILKEVE